MSWQSPFSAFSPRVTSTTSCESPPASSSTDSSPEAKPTAAAVGAINGHGGFRRGSTSTSPGSDSDVPLSRTHQYKKITKPLLERKRRARINKCLDELKEIMTVALQAEGENVSKLEKADILELTVRHLHKLSQSRRLMVRNPLDDLQKFQAGYSSCAQEAASFLLSNPGVDMRMGQRLLSHLSSTAGPAMAAHLTAPGGPAGPHQPPNYPQVPPQAAIPPPCSSAASMMARKLSPPPSPPTSAAAAMAAISQYNQRRRSLGSETSISSSFPVPFPPHSSTIPTTTAHNSNLMEVDIKKELPDTNSSSPPLTVTQGSFTLSIRRHSPEPLAERTQNEKMNSIANPAVIRPAAIRLNPTKTEAVEPVWRPYSST